MVHKTTQLELARHLGVSKQAIAHIGTGEYRSGKTVEACAEAMGCTVDWLTKGIGAPPDWMSGNPSVPAIHPRAVEPRAADPRAVEQRTVDPHLREAASLLRPQPEPVTPGTDPELRARISELERRHQDDLAVIAQKQSIIDALLIQLVRSERETSRLAIPAR